MKKIIHQLVITMKNLLKSIFFTWMMMLVSCGDNVDQCITLDITGSQQYHISIEKARENLQSLLDEMQMACPNAKAKRIESSMILSTSNELSRSNDSTYSRDIYVFNFDNTRGFALMASDERLPGIIALTDSGSISDGEAITNPGLALYLECVDAQIGELIDSLKNNGPFTIYGDWETDFYTENSCYVKWGQEMPYNFYCPRKGNKLAPTGCVATAVAQLMSIYEYPTSYHGYTFNWSGMKSAKKANLIQNSEYRLQIARLMEQLGTESNLNMDYREDSSGTDDAYIPRTLQAFGYSDGGRRGDYAEEKLIEELINGFPVLMSGFANRSRWMFCGIEVFALHEDGHEWVCHGLMVRHRRVSTYDSSGRLLISVNETYNYALCNWGWDGTADGYYLCNFFNPSEGPEYNDEGNEVLNPSTRPYNFRYKRRIITGIRM